MTRKLTDRLIKVICKGKFADINDRVIQYRVLVELPDCIDEWLKSNIKNRYLIETIKNGKEFIKKDENNKIINKENKNYYDVKDILSIELEESDNIGNNLIEITEKRPTFYGKSILNFSFMEIQDFAVAFGLHEIKNNGNIEDLRKDCLIVYLKKIEKLEEKDIKNLSFYKFDKARNKYYIEFTESDKNSLKITNHINIDLEEFREQDNKIREGKKNLKEVFKSQGQFVEENDFEFKNNHRKESIGSIIEKQLLNNRNIDNKTEEKIKQGSEKVGEIMEV